MEGGIEPSIFSLEIHSLNHSTTFIQADFVWKYILPVLRDKEACYGKQTWRAHSRSQEDLC